MRTIVTGGFKEKGSMGCFINRKKEKIAAVFTEAGIDVDEAGFITTFKQMYPRDWEKIIEKWQTEENSTPTGKKHPMQHPDVYMKEMYRNHMPKKRNSNRS